MLLDPPVSTSGQARHRLEIQVVEQAWPLVPSLMAVAPTASPASTAITLHGDGEEVFHTRGLILRLAHFVSTERRAYDPSYGLTSPRTQRPPSPRYRTRLNAQGGPYALVGCPTRRRGEPRTDHDVGTAHADLAFTRAVPPSIERPEEVQRSSSYVGAAQAPQSERILKSSLYPLGFLSIGQGERRPLVGVGGLMPPSPLSALREPPCSRCAGQGGLNVL